METQFLTPTDKAKLSKHLENGNKEAIDIVWNEFDRLESVIRDYEMIMKQVASRVNDTHKKTVNSLKSL